MHQRSAAPLAIASLLVIMTACDMRPTDPLTGNKLEPVAPPVATGPAAQAYNLASFQCVASRASMQVACNRNDLRPEGALGDIIVGGQNVYMTVATNNVAYNSGSGQFTFNTTLTSLIQQPIGTTDGSSLDPNGVRIFFHSGPTVTAGTGTVSPIPDGFATFTAAAQPYYQYNQILTTSVVSTPKTWTLIMPPTVTTFSFQLYVSAPVQYPVGYVDIAQAPAVTLHPDVALPLTFQVKSAVGNVVPGAVVTWSTTDAAVATVDAAGQIYPLRAGTATINATDGTRPGTIAVTVGGTNRSWGGATSTDFSVGGNWPLNNIPAVSADTVTVPSTAPNMPALVAPTSLDAVVLQSTATMNMGGNSLTIAKQVSTGTGAISSAGVDLVQTGGTVNGNLPNYNVTGTVDASGDVTVQGTIKVTGTLKSVGYTIKVTP